MGFARGAGGVRSAGFGFRGLFACAALVSGRLPRWPFLDLFACSALLGCALTALAFP